MSLCVGVLQVVPTVDEIGYCDVVEVQEIGDTNVIVFRQGAQVLLRCVQVGLMQMSQLS